MDRLDSDLRGCTGLCFRHDTLKNRGLNALVYLFQCGLPGHRRFANIEIMFVKTYRIQAHAVIAKSNPQKQLTTTVHRTGRAERGHEHTVSPLPMSAMRMMPAKPLRHSGHRRPAGPDAHSRSAQSPHRPLRGIV